jgi:hypothetical protein
MCTLEKHGDSDKKARAKIASSGRPRRAMNGNIFVSDLLRNKEATSSSHDPVLFGIGCK